MPTRNATWVLAVAALGVLLWLLLASGKKKPSSSPPSQVPPAKQANRTPRPVSAKAHAKNANSVVTNKQRPALRASETIREEKKVYENPADDPDSWSDFQAAIYAYKEEVLWPRIETCWSTVNGEGMVYAMHSYDVVNGIARPQMPPPGTNEKSLPIISLETDETTLSEEELQNAITCLQSAAQGTEFHFVGLHGETELNDQFTGHWGWASPALRKKNQTVK